MVSRSTTLVVEVSIYVDETWMTIGKTGASVSLKWVYS